MSCMIRLATFGHPHIIINKIRCTMFDTSSSSMKANIFLNYIKVQIHVLAYNTILLIGWIFFLLDKIMVQCCIKITFIQQFTPLLMFRVSKEQKVAKKRLHTPFKIQLGNYIARLRAIGKTNHLAKDNCT